MKTLKKLIACALVFIMIFSLIACDVASTKSTSSQKSSEPGSEQAPLSEVQTYAYIAIDINPSVELVIADDAVVSVRACNDDASVLLFGEDFTGLTPEQATEKIVALAEELGYLNDDNTGVKVTVSADTEEEGTELEEKTKRGAEKGSSRAIVNFNPRLADEREVKELKDKNAELYKDLTPSKLRLINSLMEYDPEMTVEIGSAMTNRELIEALREYADEHKDIAGEELKRIFKERKEAIRLEREQLLADIFGEEYLNAWNKLVALEGFYEELEKKAESLTLSEEDINAIIAVIGEEHADDIAIDGKVTVESVEHFFDRRMNEELKSVWEQIEAILDKYDEDDYALSEEELAKLTELYGEVEAIILEDVEELIDNLEDQLDAFKEQLESNEVIKQAMDEIKNSFDAKEEEIKAQLKEEFKTEMENAIKHFEEQKANRAPHKGESEQPETQIEPDVNDQPVQEEATDEAVSGEAVEDEATLQ